MEAAVKELGNGEGKDEGELVEILRKVYCELQM